MRAFFLEVWGPSCASVLLGHVLSLPMPKCPRWSDISTDLPTQGLRQPRVHEGVAIA